MSRIGNDPVSATSTGATESTAIDRAADRARIEGIDSQILELQHAIEVLEQEKTSAQGRLDAYVYPVLTLPNEIMSEIFIHFLPVYPKPSPLMGPCSPSFLGRICRKWREIALATPALWRAIRLTSCKQGRLEQQFRLGETFLERSRSCPLSIELAFNPNHYLGMAAREMPFLQNITRHSGRWEHLKIDLPVDYLPSIEGPLPLLRRLQMQTSFGDPDTGNEDALTSAFHLAPLLSSAHIYIFGHTHRNLFPWAQLTVLRVEWIEEPQLIHVLGQAVNLVSCYCKVYNPIGATQSRNNLSLPYLENLILSKVFDSSPSTFFDMLIIPALRRLQVDGALLRPAPITKLVSLVSRSGCKLDELYIPDVVGRFERVAYRRALPSVSSVIFSVAEMEIEWLANMWKDMGEETEEENEEESDTEDQRSSETSDTDESSSSDESD